MSYDLYFRAKSGPLNAAEISRYFSARPNYKTTSNQAFYENSDTGVYFSFEIPTEQGQRGDQDDGHEAVAFNINYFRPSYFVLEAEPEVTAFASHFDLAVSDPQTEGMGEGPYRADKLISGWNQGNAFGYRAIIKTPAEKAKTFSLPSAMLTRIWRWNHEKARLQDHLGSDLFVPRIAFLNVSGEVFSFIIWPDAIPTVIPKVDFVLVPRKTLAPRRFFQPMADRALISWAQAHTKLQPYDARKIKDVLVPNFLSPPTDVVSYVKSLPALKDPPPALPSDQVLDRELVEAVTF